MKVKTVMCWRCLDIHPVSDRRIIKHNGHDRNACPKCRCAVFLNCTRRESEEAIEIPDCLRRNND